MKRAIHITSLFLFLCLSCSLRAEIRKFDKATIEKLGVAIFEQDSLLHRMAFYVATPDQHVWKVQSGKMEIVK